MNRQQELDNALFAAAASQPAHVVLELVRQGANINAREPSNLATPLHYAAAGNNAALRMLLRLGAKPTLPTMMGDGPPLFIACSARNVAGVSLLVQYLTPQDIRYTNAMWHDALQHQTHPDPEICLRLLDAGIDPHKRKEAVAKHYYDPPPPKSITREALLSGERNALQFYTGWNKIVTIKAQLASRGTPLTKEDLLTDYDGHMNYIMHAAKCGRLETAMEHLHSIGEQLTVHDLLDKEGRITPMLAVIIEHQAVQSLMSFDNWKGQSPAALREFWCALPESGREQVDNYRSLSVQVDAQPRPSPQAGR